VAKGITISTFYGLPHSRHATQINVVARYLEYALSQHGHELDGFFIQLDSLLLRRCCILCFSRVASFFSVGRLSSDRSHQLRNLKSDPANELSAYSLIIHLQEFQLSVWLNADEYRTAPFPSKRHPLGRLRERTILEQEHLRRKIGLGREHQ